MHKKILKIIKENRDPLLLVVPDLIKHDILTNLNDGLYNVAFITMSEVIDRLSFTFNEEAIYMVMKQYQVGYDIAKTYLNNLKYLQYIDKKTEDLESKKVELLDNIYHFLDNNNLIVKDFLFETYCQKKKIIIYGYPYLKKEELYLLDKINYVYLPIEYNIKLTTKVLACKSFADELFYAIEAICKLISNKVPLSDIKIVGIDKENYFYARQMFKMYQIPVNLNEKTSLYNYDITKTIIENYRNHTFEYDKDNLIQNEVIKVLNKFVMFEENEVLYNCVTDSLKNTYIKDKVNTEAIEVVDINSILYLQNKYIFILGFNQGKIPINYKDEDYFSDKFKALHNLTTTEDLNKNAQDIILKVLATNNNFHLSYNTEDTPSPVIENLKLNINNVSSTYYSKYSDKFNEILLVRYLDTYLKYGTKSKVLLDLVKTYKIPYLQYDNKFTGINYVLDNKKLNLSYTSIDTYYKCSFMYYIKRVLRLDMFIENFTTYIGSLFHKVLSVAFSDNFDFEKEYNDFVTLSNYELSPKEEFLLKKLKTELHKIIEIITEQSKYINFESVMYEESLNVNINNPEFSDYEISFGGIIDKIWYKTLTDEDGNEVTYISIVDYKTGKLDIKLDLVPYGLSLQLPVYLYLASHSNLPNVKVYGFFLQNILQPEIKANNEEDYLAQKRKALMLSGYIVDKVPNEFEFDRSKSDSKIIKSLRQKNDGSYYKYSKVLTEDKINNIIASVEDNIIKASSDIIKGKFDINPKISNNINLSCQFCSFSDLCYKKYQDHKRIEVGEEDELD